MEAMYHTVFRRLITAKKWLKRIRNVWTRERSSELGVASSICDGQRVQTTEVGRHAKGWRIGGDISAHYETAHL